MRAFLLILALSILGSCASNPYESSSKNKLCNKIIAKAAAQISKETGLIPCGTGGQAMHQIEMLALAFDYRHEVEIQEGRKLLVMAVDRFVETINQNQDVQKYLGNYPFGPQNVEVRIFLTQPNRDSLPVGALHVISSLEGILKYKTENLDSGQLETIYSETYEEAVEKLAHLEKN